MVKEKYLVFASRELPIFMVSGFFAIIFKMNYFPNQENYIEVYGSTIIVVFIPVFFYYAFQLIGIEFLKLKYPNKNRSNYSTDNKFKNTKNYILYNTVNIFQYNTVNISHNITNIYKNNFVLSKQMNKPKTEEERNEKTLDKAQIKAINTIKNYSIDTLNKYIEGDYLEVLCNHIEVLVEGGTDFSNLGSVKVNDNLNKQDLYHFGWNIWSYLNNNCGYSITQKTIADFLISLFENLKDSKKETIVNNMTKEGNDKIKKDVYVMDKYKIINEVQS